MHNARLGKTDDPKNEPVVVVMKSPALYNLAMVPTLGCISKVDNRVPESLPLNSDHIVLGGAFDDIANNPVHIRGQAPARSPGCLHIDSRFKKGKISHQFLDFVDEYAVFEEALKGCGGPSTRHLLCMNALLLSCGR